MKNKTDIIEQQKDFIIEMKAAADNFVTSINKAEIQAVLLSGSVARGDFFPKRDENGEDVGMVDLIVMRNNGSFITAEEIFGPNQDSDSPYHCIKIGKVWFQILFIDFITAEIFSLYEEARKFSILESKILYDKNNLYETELEKIKTNKIEECQEALQNKINYIDYLISDYKTDRWRRRDAFLQLHENLNNALRMAVCCLYYINNSYVPAEDRQLYYSLTLSNLPKNYESLIFELKNQNTASEDDYNRRENLFRKTILDFIIKSGNYNKCSGFSNS